MLTVNGNPLLADEVTILLELQSQLHLRGIPLLNKVIPGATNIQFNCPIHKDGQERRPSCGLATSSNNQAIAGTVHCFTCGYTATLEEMISHCFGYNDFGSFGKEWLIKNFLTATIENRKDLNLNMEREPRVNQTSYISEQELDSYRYIHPYMYQRKLTDEIIEKFDVGFDPNFKLGGKTIESITFPVRNLNGDTLFIARRAIHSKLFHYPEGVNKPIYGLFELDESAQEVIICESIINALTCYVYGKPAIALLGLGTKDQFEFIKRLPVRKLILGLDPDKAGQAAAFKLKEKMKGHRLVTNYTLPEGKDLNDLTEKEFKNLQETF